MTFIESFDGIKLYYETSGAGKPLVFSHAWMTHHGFFKHQIEFFQRDYQTIAHDTRGHGQSEYSSKNYRIETFAKDLNLILEHLNIEKAVFLGHSMGGHISLSFYSQFPEKVEALILIDTTYKSPFESYIPGGQLYNPFLKATLRGSRLLSQIINPSKKLARKNLVYRALVKYMIHSGPKSKSDDVKLLEDSLLDVPHEVATLAVEAMMDLNFEKLLPKIAVPTLIICGTIDWLSPLYVSQRMAKKIKKAELFTLNRIGHMSMMDSSVEVNQKLREFLNKINY
ncbi:MAG: alpha/beta hydrolase [Candidatus Helarchaeota archaeon]|nr:alpha/beta hydrolase [Candidatus Helarchaeota archaeon]